MEVLASPVALLGNVVVFVVNRHPGESVDLAVDLRAFPGARLGDGSVLADDDWRAANTADQPYRVVPRPHPKAEVAELLANYQKACREGRLTEAKGFAERALTLDPRCFCDGCPH